MLIHSLKKHFIASLLSGRHSAGHLGNKAHRMLGLPAEHRVPLSLSPSTGCSWLVPGSLTAAAQVGALSRRDRNPILAPLGPLLPVSLQHPILVPEPPHIPGYYRLSVSSKNSYVPQNVTICGNRAFKEVIKVK